MQGVSIGLLPLLSFLVAVAVIGALQFVLYRTALVIVAGIALLTLG